ncbi:hypothetical protein MSPP1_003083 [Malassezia sp. CBS 17886]|nr:hypothetical protein MSPP1_003083 [Malassezia sp. CBS 17886]
MHAFAGVSEAWQRVALADVQEALAQGVGRAESAQSDALQSRTALAERTRAFKRVDPSTQLQAVRPLLKAYQAEIDALTARARGAETLLGDAHARLAGAPDPTPALASLLDADARTRDADALRGELVSMRAELHASRTDAQRSADERAAAQQAAAEQLAAASRRAREREQQLQHDADTAQSHLRDLHARHEQATAQLLAHSRATHAAPQHDYSVLLADLQRANERAAHAERARVRVQEALAAQEEAAAQHQLQINRLTTRAAEDAAAQAKESEAKARAASDAGERAAAEHRTLQDALVAARRDVEALREALLRCADYDEVKRELGVLKSPPAADATTTLEKNLVWRNRRLQDDLATLRATLREERWEAHTSVQTLGTQHARIAELEARNAQLENDLLGVASPPRGAGAPTAPAAGTTPPASTHASMLPIVTAQRDRFRMRNGELEQELGVQSSTVGELRGEVKRLQADNLGMYEKIRYLHAYGRPAPSADQPYPPSRTRSDVDGAYRIQYEQSLHPFEAFRGSEQSRAVAALGPIDRFLHMFVRAVLGHAHMRLVVVCYALVLHLLVFGMLFDAGHRLA